MANPAVARCRAVEREKAELVAELAPATARLLAAAFDFTDEEDDALALSAESLADGFEFSEMAARAAA